MRTKYYTIIIIGILYHQLRWMSNSIFVIGINLLFVIDTVVDDFDF